MCELAKSVGMREGGHLPQVSFRPAENKEVESPLKRTIELCVLYLRGKTCVEASIKKKVAL